MWPSEWAERAKRLAAKGMYDPQFEHDSCGVGLVAAIDGKPRRDIVELAVAALKSVWHRGAVDADGKTGDGAGIHLQIPRAFFTDELARSGKRLPESTRIAVGMVFLPKRRLAAQETCRAIIESEILRMGHQLLGWRQVPIDASVIGTIANDSRPEIEQVIIGQREGVSEEAFERELYIIRRRIENEARAAAIFDFYVCSLSCRSVIYKGLFKAEQLTAFYPDLLDSRFVSNYALYHQRFSTNTAPAWNLAQPFRTIAHNGEINTLRGNLNFMRGHEAGMEHPFFNDCMDDLRPVVAPNLSDTGALDAVMELLVQAGHPMPLAKLILVPPAWGDASNTTDAQRHMFKCLNTISEPWDGPAAIAAMHGDWVVAGMDRGGLRPMRYAITGDGLIVLGSESGMVPVEERNILEKGRLGPGDVLGINLAEGRLYKDPELKEKLAAEQPYAEWAGTIESLKPEDLRERTVRREMDDATLHRHHLAVGATFEELELILHPMAATAKEGVGSMGDDTPLAMLSREPRGFHHFFRQQFSQVTNPPIDSLREKRVMSLKTRFGNDGNFLALDNSRHASLLLETPYLLSYEMAQLSARFPERITHIDTLFKADGGEGALRKGLDRLVLEAERAVRAGRTYLLLSDEGRSAEYAAIPMILAVAAINTHLLKKKLRKRSSILVRTAEVYDVHHFAVLVGCGATVVNAYAAEETILQRHGKGLLSNKTARESLLAFQEAMGAGLLKIMSKLGISVVSSYRNGYNYEIIGLSRALVNEFFPGLPSRLSGLGLRGIESRILRQHALAFDPGNVVNLPAGGFYRYRAGQEKHAYDAQNIHLLQTAVTNGSYQQYKTYSEHVWSAEPITLRQLLDFNSPQAAIELDRVESVTEIRKRFAVPAMSLGALGPEAHETLAIAMNRMGGMCNSGEGGEDPKRYTPYANGDNANSTIKQIASARFGVTAAYLNAAQELQIKVAQGAKPGEGGQLPGFKVTEMIARLRHATEGVTLISPPPHHDIYSIEDLAQLIYDLKQINPRAIVSVKLVSQAGIGTVASGVAKAMADKIIIAGHTGGTGASPYSSIKFAGTPWEMGLAEVHQALTLNRLRHRIRLQTDGGIKTGRDVVMAAMLGAEEYALGTASLVAMGCLMVRQCHSNTCPVGICTQDEALRAKFGGSVEKVINLFSFIAEEVREILAQLGFETLEEIIGRTDLLHQIHRGGDDLVDLDLNPLLVRPDGEEGVRHCPIGTRNDVAPSLDEQMLEDAKEALAAGQKIQLAYNIRNVNRTVGTRLSSMLTRKYNTDELPEDFITLRLRGSAGQSLGAFLVRGVKIEVLGDTNDYVGKGLSGGMITVRPRPSSSFVPQDNTIIGNTVLYGATSGSLYACGQAGERFAVRNSGATAVIEGCGSNGCEYMTGGSIAILGPVGDNFAAGMTGGMAFVYDKENRFAERVNDESVVYQRVETPYWRDQLHSLVSAHFAQTESPLARALLAGFEFELKHFWQVCPKEMVGRLTHPLVEPAASARPFNQ